MRHIEIFHIQILRSLCVVRIDGICVWFIQSAKGKDEITLLLTVVSAVVSGIYFYSKTEARRIAVI